MDSVKAAIVISPLGVVAQRLLHTPLAFMEAKEAAAHDELSITDHRRFGPLYRGWNTHQGRAQLLSQRREALLESAQLVNERRSIFSERQDPVYYEREEGFAGSRSCVGDEQHQQRRQQQQQSQNERVSPPAYNTLGQHHQDWCNGTCEGRCMTDKNE